MTRRWKCRLVWGCQGIALAVIAPDVKRWIALIVVYAITSEIEVWLRGGDDW